MSQKVEVRTESIEARDGQALSSTIYAPAVEPERVVVVAAATGVKQAFYEPYARFLARSGCAVITFDYRGIGRSLTSPIKKVRATIRDWGEKDYPSVLDFAHATFPGKKVQVVGHSVGGQLVGIVENAHRLSAVCTVGSQHGYWRLFPWRQALPYGLLWYVIMPLLAHVLGYFPSRRFGLGENLPKGVALEWARFARNRNYMVADDGTPLRAGFRSFEGAVRAYSLADDVRAPERAVRALHAYYEKADVEYCHVDPKARALPPVGHVGFFFSKFKTSLWSETLEWLRAH